MNAVVTRTPGDDGAVASAVLAGHLERLGLDGGAARLRLHRPCGAPHACCEPGVVHLRPPADARGFWREGGLGRLMLAHEAAHVAQFALGGATASRSLLEREADTLGPRLARGEACRVRLSAAPGRLHWNRAGHYYTIYLIALVAGATEQDAQKMAFYGQLPDLVSEFDAVTQAEIALGLRDDWGAFGATMKLTYDGNAGKQPDDWEVCRDVVEGLHCLTGAAVADERRKRMTILSQSSWGGLRFGVALHAFGDAYAHCTGGKMYGNKYGHFSFWGGHDPDNINLHQAEYIEYVERLHEVMSGKIAKSAGGTASARPTFKDILADLKEMAAQYPTDEYEVNQIAYLRGLIQGMSTQRGLAAYQPAYDCLPWSEFYAKVNGWNLKPGDFDTIMGFAQEWRSSERDTRTSAARIQEVKDRLDAQTRAMSGPRF